MKTNSTRFAYAALFGLFAVYACHSWFGPDIWYHLSWGRDLVTNLKLMPTVRTLVPQPLPANIYWIFQSLIYGLYAAGGLLPVSALFALTWLATGVLWLHLTGAFQKNFGPLLLFVLIVLAQTRFEERPEVFSYLFLLLLIWRTSKLERTSQLKRELFYLFAIENVWTAFHGYFALGPLVAGAFAFAGPRQRGLLALAACALGSVTGPFGVAVWKTVWAYAELGREMADINQELFRPQIWPLSWPFSLFWATWAVVAALSVRAFILKERVFFALIACGGLALSAQASRNVPLLVFLGAPILNAPWNLNWRVARLINVGLVVIALILAFRFIRPERGAGELSTFGIKREWSSYPIGLVEALKALNFRGRIFTDSYDGGYVEFEMPDVYVAGDSYFSDPKSTRAYFMAIKDPIVFKGWLERNHFDALDLNVENYLIVDQVLSNPQWRLAYADSHRALFLPENGVAPFALSEARFWHGESLVNANTAFGPTTWAAIAAHRGDVGLVKKIVSDISASEQIPVTLWQPLSEFAQAHGDQELNQQLESLKGKLAACCH